MTGVKFGDFDMQSGGCVVVSTDVYSPPENEIQADELAEADGAVVVQQRYKSKTFTVDGHLRASTVSAFRDLLDAFKLAMSVRNQAFDISEEDGVIRRYLANAKNMILARTSPTSCSFSIQFLSPDGMGWDVDATELLAPTGITTSGAQIPITVGGTYRAEPSISVTVNSVTGGTAKPIKISNGSTLRSLTVERDWAAGDLLEIDSLNKTVYVNNSPVEFGGQFPRWDTGPGTIGWLDTFTTRNVTISASHTQRYL